MIFVVTKIQIINSNILDLCGLFIKIIFKNLHIFLKKCCLNYIGIFINTINNFYSKFQSNLFLNYNRYSIIFQLFNETIYTLFQKLSYNTSPLKSI